MALRVGRLGHVGIAVRDMERSVSFYTEVLGMGLTEQFNYGLDEVGHGVAVLSDRRSQRTPPITACRSSRSEARSSHLPNMLSVCITLHSR